MCSTAIGLLVLLYTPQDYCLGSSKLRRLPNACLLRSLADTSGKSTVGLFLRPSTPPSEARLAQVCNQVLPDPVS